MRAHVGVSRVVCARRELRAKRGMGGGICVRIDGCVCIDVCVYGGVCIDVCECGGIDRCV